MRPIKVTLDMADASLTGFASNVTGATWTLTTTATTDGLAHRVSIKNDAATDHSGKTAILTGTDYLGNTLTETVTLPAGTATVESTKYFKTLTSVVPSATIGADTMDIGWVDEVEALVYLEHRCADKCKIETIVTGTINYTLQDTLDYENAVGITAGIPDYGSITWKNIDDADLVSATANQKTVYDSIPVMSRIVINSYSSGAALVVMYVHQTDGGLA